MRKYSTRVSHAVAAWQCATNPSPHSARSILQATDAELKRAHTAAYVRQVDAFFRPGVTKCLEGSVQRELLEGAQGNVEEQEQEPEKVAPLDAQGDNLMINTNLFVGKHTALAARTAAGCAVEVRARARGGPAGRACLLAHAFWPAPTP